MAIDGVRAVAIGRLGAGVHRRSDSDRLSVPRSRLGRAVIAYSLGPHYQPCGTADEEGISARMQKGDAPRVKRAGHGRVVQCFAGLQFDQTRVVDQQVYEMLACQDVIVVHLGAVLLHSR
jgi:hypothetical protein